MYLCEKDVRERVDTDSNMLILTELQVNPSDRREELGLPLRAHEVEQQREVGDCEVEVLLEDGAVRLDGGGEMTDLLN